MLASIVTGEDRERGEDLAGFVAGSRRKVELCNGCVTCGKCGSERANDMAHLSVKLNGKPVRENCRENAQPAQKSLAKSHTTSVRMLPAEMRHRIGAGRVRSGGFRGRLNLKQQSPKHL